MVETWEHGQKECRVQDRERSSCKDTRNSDTHKYRKWDLMTQSTCVQHSDGKLWSVQYQKLLGHGMQATEMWP